MSSLVDTLFGGQDDSAQKAQIAANKEYFDFIKQMGLQARGDAIALGGGSFDNRNMGYDAALGVFGQTMPQQLDVFQQGNVGAQAALLAGLPQMQNAILGGPLDPNFMSPVALNYDAGYTQQELPQFIPISDLLGGGGVNSPFGGSGPIGQGNAGGGGSSTERVGIPSDRPGPGTGEANAGSDFDAILGHLRTGVESGQVSDEFLKSIERMGDNKLARLLAGMAMPGLGSVLWGAGEMAGRALDTRFGERLSDYNNREWGNYDSTSPTNDFGYYEDLLGYDPTDFSNPLTGARLGEAGGMPGARHSGADIMEMYGGQVNVPRNMNLGYARNRFRTSNTMPNDAFNQSTRGGTYYIWSPLSLT